MADEAKRPKVTLIAKADAPRDRDGRLRPAPARTSRSEGKDLVKDVKAIKEPEILKSSPERVTGVRPNPKAKAAVKPTAKRVPTKRSAAAAGLPETNGVKRRVAANALKVGVGIPNNRPVKLPSAPPAPKANGADADVWGLALPIRRTPNRFGFY